MTGDVLTVLTDDLADTADNAPELDDRQLTRLYETLTLTGILDVQVGELQQSGQVGFWVPSGEAATVAVGAAFGLLEHDWYFPGLRDAGAFLARGGSVEQLTAQILGSIDDPAKGRSVAGHGCLPEGRFVHPAGSLGAHVQHAAGAALAMRHRGATSIALASFGAASLSHGSVQGGMEIAVSTDTPVVFLCRTPPARLSDLRARALGCGIEVVLADGSDALAVLKAVRLAREHALEQGPVFIGAVTPTSGDGSAAEDGAARLLPFLEHRKLWDAEREEELRQRASTRVTEAIQAALAAGAAPADTIFDDVYAARSWMLQEQSERLQRGAADG